MTRRAYYRCVDPRVVEVRRLLDRYLVEIVEAYELCPWARAARLGDELAVEIVWGPPSDADWIAAARAALARPRARVALVVAPELAASTTELRAIRDRVAAAIAIAGVAEFHPDAALDLASPARAVPFLRRSPDPMLQLVPLALLAAVRAPPPIADRAQQAAALHGLAPPPPQAVADRIAATNHARLAVDAGAIAARLDDIAADRARSYPRVGIAISACRARR